MAGAHDLFWAVAIWAGVYHFRLSLAPGEPDYELLLATLPVAVAIQMGCFLAFGLYRGIWRYASLHETAAANLSARFHTSVDIKQLPPAWDAFFPFQHFAKNHAVAQQ